MTFVRSPYQHKRTQKITGIVIHTTVGAYQGTINWFMKNPNSVSAHYVVKEDGAEITQMVEDDCVAYHAGIVSKPTTPVYKGGNPNEYTLGIENADYGDPHNTDRTAQYKTLIKLVYDLCKKHDLPIDSDHICGHKEIRSTKTCPGNIDVSYVITEARKLQGEPMPGEDLEKQLSVCKSEQVKNEERILSARTDRDAIYTALGADNLEGAKNTVTGLRSRITDLGNQLGTSQAEVFNREEQVSRLKDEVLTFNFDKKDLEARLEESKVQLNEFGKDKGALVIEVQQLKTQVESLKKAQTEGGVTITVKEFFTLLLNQKITIRK